MLICEQRLVIGAGYFEDRGPVGIQERTRVVCIGPEEWALFAVKTAPAWCFSRGVWTGAQRPPKGAPRLIGTVRCGWSRCLAGAFERRALLRVGHLSARD